MKAELFDEGTNDLLPRSFIHRGYVNRNGKVEQTGVRVFDSLEAFGTIAHASPLHYEGDDDWCGGSEDDAYRMSTGEGWQEAIGQVEAITTHVANLVDAETVSDSFSYRYDVVGGSIDIGRFLTGEPECMIEAHPVPLARRGKVARIVVPVCYSAGVSVDIVKRRGAAVVALIDSLARAHYSLEVWAVAALHNHSEKGGRDFPHRIAYSVKVTDAAMAYDPAMVAYGVGHPTMLRRLTFDCENMENDATKRAFGIAPYGTGYGNASYDARIDDLPEYARNGPAVILPELRYGRASQVWGDDESIARWIEDQVRMIAEGGEYESNQSNTY